MRAVADGNAVRGFKPGEVMGDLLVDFYQEEVMASLRLVVQCIEREVVL